jgi:hypothetical protein
MKFIYRVGQLIILPLIIFLVFISFTENKNLQDKGPHGGIVKKAENYFIELKNTEDLIKVYLLDNNMKTKENEGISGDARFYLSDNTDFTVELMPEQQEAFSAKGIPGYLTCKITFNVFGRPISARFENEKLIAGKN